MRTGSKSGQRTPADGDAFLTSAIRAMDPAGGCRNAAMKSRRPLRFSRADDKSLTVTARGGRSALSRFFCSTMVSRMFTGVVGCLLLVVTTHHPQPSTYSDSALIPCLRLAVLPALAHWF